MFEVRKQLASQLFGQSKRGFATIKLKNIKSLVGFEKESDNFVHHQDCEVVIKSGKIAKIGQNIQTEEFKDAKEIDMKGALVTPGFVDPHTHIFPPTDRANEFAMRVNTSYQDIAAAGGGILSSVKACRQASFDEIYAVNERNVQRFIAQGTMTLEMKSGYGLNTETEIKLLQVINKLKQNYKKQIDIVPTFLGAHAVPPEFKDNIDGYVNLLLEETIPEVGKLRLAEFCDVFCEKGYFDIMHTRKIMKAAKKNKMAIRLHADEFVDSGAAKLSGQLRAYSADHLMAVSEEGIKSLGDKQVVATMLPGTTVFLGSNTFAPVRKMIDSGVRVAVATDYNPGSSVFNSQPLMMAFAMQYGKLTLQESLMAVTKNAALSLKRKNAGIICEGAQADLLVWNLDNLAQIPYHNAESSRFIKYYIKKGRIFPRKKVMKPFSE